MPRPPDDSSDRAASPDQSTLNLDSGKLAPTVTAPTMTATTESGQTMLHAMIDEARRQHEAAGPALRDLADPHPDRIGPYRIVRPIGKGGMGVVCEAEQDQPRRTVALKLMRRELGDESDLRRFHYEAEILGRLRHPGIAHIYDAGTFGDGRPYYAMEYIPQARTLLAWADEQNLNLRQRLELMAAVADAVHHAHQHGIIHRDLKPANILVDATGQPKVIDFGVAKLMHSFQSSDFSSQPEAYPAVQSPAEIRKLKTENRTAAGQLIGTLRYMSPEQCSGESHTVDVRSDVYTLGVILFELLTGRMPYDVPQDSLIAAAAVIRDRPPQRPSLLDRHLRGDVETIILKALEKEIDRRYASVNAFAADIHRYLNHEPIAARPPSAMYQLRKFARRNRTLVGGAAATFAMLIVGLIGMGLLTRWALSERTRAEHETDKARVAEAEQRRLAKAEAVARKEEARERMKAEEINEFVTQALVSSDPNYGGSQGFLVTAAMDQAIKLLDAGELKDQPETDAALRLSIARILNGNARSQEALRLAERALQIYQQLHADNHPDLQRSLNSVASCLASLGRLDEALPRFEAALEMCQRLSGGEDPQVATILNNVAACLRRLGRPEEALPKFRAALEMRKRLLQGDHPDVASSMNNLAFCLEDIRGPAEALPEYLAAQEMRERLFRGDHPDVVASMNNVAACLASLGRLEEALPKFEVALEMCRRLFQGDHPNVAMGLNNVAACLKHLDRPAEALPKYEAALEMEQRLFPGDHPDLASSLTNVAACLVSLDRPAEALAKLETSLEMRQRLFRHDHPDVAASLTSVAFCLLSLGRPAEALPKYEAALEMEQRLFPGDRPDLASSLNNVANCLVFLGRPAEALPKYEAALQMEQRLFPGDHPHMATSLNYVAYCLESLDRPAEALPKYEAALEMEQRLFPGDHSDLASSLSNVAECLVSVGRAAEALPKYEAALEMRVRILAPDHPDIATSRRRLGELLTRLERFSEAEHLLLRAAARPDRPDAPARLRQCCLANLVQLYDAWHAAEPAHGYDAKAAEWRTKLAEWQASTQPAANPSGPNPPPASP